MRRTVSRSTCSSCRWKRSTFVWARAENVSAAAANSVRIGHRAAIWNWSAFMEYDRSLEIQRRFLEVPGGEIAIELAQPALPKGVRQRAHRVKARLKLAGNKRRNHVARKIGQVSLPRCRLLGEADWLVNHHHFGLA